MNRPALDYRTLSVAERIQLVEDIWDSIAAENAASMPLNAAQSAELAERLAAHEADPSAATSWSSVRTELFKPAR